MEKKYYRDNFSNTQIKISSKPLRKRILSKFGNRCAYCGEALTMNTLQVDHVFPHIRDSFSNLFPSCKRCNSIKRNLKIPEFREKLTCILLDVPSFSEKQISYLRQNSYINLDEIILKRKLLFYCEVKHGFNLDEDYYDTHSDSDLFIKNWSKKSNVLKYILYTFLLEED